MNPIQPLKRSVAFLLLYVMLSKNAIAFVVPRIQPLPPWGGTYPMLDLFAVTALKNYLIPSFKNISEASATVLVEHKIVNAELLKTQQTLKNINEQYRKNVNLIATWNKDTDPNLVQLKARLSPIMSDFKALDNDLDKYEVSNFLNTAADVNKGIQYGKGYLPLVKIIEQNSMCQSAPTGGNTYASLRESSCRIYHNATAYKKALYDSILQKQDLLKKATKIIMDSNLNTIGEHDARKTMLLELEVLYQETADDFKLRLNNADIQAHIARDTELYAAQAIDFGVNSSVMMEAEKAVIGGAIVFTLSKVTPYNK